MVYTHQTSVRFFLLFAFLITKGVKNCFSDDNPSNNYSGWQGGIGIAFGYPAKNIPDVTELGYEIEWGGDEDIKCAKILNISLFRYWNSIVELHIKDPGGRYDFSEIEDKNEAARLAFDAWAEISFGIKGLSKYASVKYTPDGNYGDVYGVMDLSSENPLVVAVIDTYLKWFIDKGVKKGGIALDNAGKVPIAFLEALNKKFHAKGLGIATNGCPEECLPFIDFFGNEGFPFTVDFARNIRSKGFKGILGEFTTRHLSSGELESYIKTKLFNGIVFFGYTDGGTAAGSHYSGYCCRPDVYNHHRYVLRKYIPLSRNILKAGIEKEPYALLKLENKVSEISPTGISSVKITEEGKVYEKQQGKEDINVVPISSPYITRYGKNISDGIYLYINSPKKADVICDVKKLGIDRKTLVFDEFNEKILISRLNKNSFEFTVDNFPLLVQLGSKEAITKNIISRIKELLNQQLIQRKMDKEIGLASPLKPWAKFCQGWTLDESISRSGKFSMKTIGSKYIGPTPKWKYYNRQGAAQFVVLNQKKASPVILNAYSKSENVLQSNFNAITNRRQHFVCRESYIYSMHLYIDYQDGQWPEVHTVSFSPGTHDWENKSITVIPKKPIKTAMVLLEFHQPQGTAWFDDISLVQAIEPEKNLLSYPGFEKGDFDINKLNLLGAEYETKINSFLVLLETTLKNKGITKSDILKLEKEIEVLEGLITDAKVEHLWQRELRDLSDIKNKLEICLRVLTSRS